MKWIQIFWLLGWLSAGLQAADETRPTGRRFLLVVEASASTGKLGSGVEDAVRGLLVGSFAGKIGPGDTLGFWAYAAGLDARFPMQVWKQDSAVALTDVLVRHMQTLKSDEPPIWENIRPSLQKVVAASDDLTVAIVSSPGNRLVLEGELNDRIGAIYASAEADLRKNRLPFVTFLAVRGGRLVDAAVNSGIGPWTIPDPPVPPRAQPVPAKKPVGASSPRPKTIPKAEPLPPVLAHSNASQVFAAVAETRRNESAAPKPREAVDPVAIPAGIPIQPSPSESAPAPTPSSAVVMPAPVELSAPSLETSVQPAAQATAAPVAPEPASLVEAKVPPPETAAPPPAAMSAPAGNASRAGRSPDPILGTATVSRMGYLVGGAGLLAAALGLVAWQATRRRRSAPSASLITRSFDRR
jgi:hypothetical protein